MRLSQAYVERAKEEGFSVNVHISLPDKLPVNATQLAVAISNALDNAIHAGMAENEKKLELISSYNSTCITVIIKNTFNGNVEIGDDESSRSNQKFRRRAWYRHTFDNCLCQCK